jgi:hypothetical protein
MNALPLSDVLAAAAYALIAERWQQAYIHDMRGGLQTLRNAVELLSRAAKIPGDNPAALEKSAALAKRAMDSHEKSLTSLVHQLTPPDEAAVSMNLGELAGEVLRFLRVGASIKSIVLTPDMIPDAMIVAQPYKCRLLILGICTALIDGLDPGATIEVVVARSESDVVMEFRSALPCPVIRNPEELWHSAGSTLPSYGLMVALGSQWAGAKGGRVDCRRLAELQNSLRICYPAARGETS